MSKKKNKGDFIPQTKKATPSKTLKERLNTIYNTIDLRTACQGRCECCKVACPSMNYCEFTQLIKEIWNNTSKSEKIDMICTSVEYFFHNQFEKFGMQTLVKPCMLLSEDGKCKWYSSRPLNCRLYGLWPKKTYTERVDKFEKAYKGLLKREEIPLNKQCPYVKRLDESTPLTTEVIEEMFKMLDNIDEKIGNFSTTQIQQKENYRTFHDWLLFKIFGEEWLSNLTNYMMASNKNNIDDLLQQIKKASRDGFSKNMPKI